MKPEQIFAKLREIAPDVVFSTSRGLDCDCPRTDEPDNLDPYSITVTATCIVGGVMLKGHAYLGGCWMEYVEAIDDIGGYLPQMLQEAAIGLRQFVLQRGGMSIARELDYVERFIREEMHNRCEKQHAENL